MKSIAKTLGLTPAGLQTLAKAAADPGGWATGDGKGYGAMGACSRLIKDGLVERAKDTSKNDWTYTRYRITAAGRDRVVQARKLGW